MKYALAGFVALVVAAGVAASCGGSISSTGPSVSDGGGGEGATSCGGSGEPCCNGAACDNGLTCAAGTCSGSGPDSSSSSSGGPGGGSGSGSGGSSSGSSDGGGTGSSSGSSPSSCRGGVYTGTFAGTYTSHLAGLPLSVTGNVDLMLDQEGSAQQTCMLTGESMLCSNLFSLQDGTITGVFNGTYPFFCTVTGTLNCQGGKLVNGWMQCTYCVGPLADGGGACGTPGVGGQFAGTLTANYDSTTRAFVMGTWNGAEALGGNNGASPGPEGGPATSYLSDSGTYSAPGDFGGSGMWNAAWQ